MDLVIPCKTANSNEELRYALRSIDQNLVHDEVFTVGYHPAWVRNTGHIPYRQGRSKYKNTTEAMRQVCMSPEVSDNFIWSNDDIFTIQLVTDVPRLNRGPLQDIINLYQSKGSNVYVQGMEKTRDLLIAEGFGNLLCYELHVPMIINKAAMLECLDYSRQLQVFHKRTFYGNVVNYAGEHVNDCKVYAGDQNWRTDFPFVSTSDVSFSQYSIGVWLREQFPEPCHYENHAGLPQKGRLDPEASHVSPGRPVTGPLPSEIIQLGESE